MSPSHSQTAQHSAPHGQRADHAHGHRNGSMPAAVQPARHDDEYDDGLVHGHFWASSAASHR